VHAASVAEFKRQTLALDEHHTSAGARSMPETLPHPWKAAAAAPLSPYMEAVA
jgi:hypothetical protein